MLQQNAFLTAIDFWQIVSFFGSYWKGANHFCRFLSDWSERSCMAAYWYFFMSHKERKVMREYDWNRKPASISFISNLVPTWACWQVEIGNQHPFLWYQTWFLPELIYRLKQETSIHFFGIQLGSYLSLLTGWNRKTASISLVSNLVPTWACGQVETGNQHPFLWYQTWFLPELVDRLKQETSIHFFGIKLGSYLSLLTGYRYMWDATFSTYL